MKELENKTNLIKKILTLLLLFFGFFFPIFVFAVNAPTVLTQEATNITQNSAILAGEVTDCGGCCQLSVWFEYGTTSAYGRQTTHQERYNIGSFSAAVSSLSSCTQYHFRAVARNNTYTGYGQDLTFITECPSNNPPVANAGPDKEVLETQSVVLEGSGSDPDGDSITFSWFCDGGTLSNPNIAQPTFTAPTVLNDTNYTCNLTVTDSHGASSTDSMNVLVKNQTLFVTLEAIPSSGHAPLYDVDLKATLSGTAIGPINYKFDCQSDGTWEYIFNGVSDNPKLVSNACDYPIGGTYNAKVYAERGAAEPAWAQATILISSPTPVVDLKINGSDGPITIPYNTSAILSWTSLNVTNCYASGDWSGEKPTSGSQSTGNLTASKTYILTCYGPSGSTSDNVTVYVTSPTLSVSLSVNPSSGCAPLSNVSLTANVSGSAAGNITYFFDCTSDGVWEKIYTTPQTSYTASNLCNFSSPGDYFAKVRAERGDQVAENTILIKIYNCYSSPEVDIKANGSNGPVTVSYGSSVALSWSSVNANSCTASGGWSGSKSLSGSQTITNLTSSKTYTITCEGSGGTDSDSVTVYVGAGLNLTLQKWVRNLSRGTNYLDSVSAQPYDVVSFYIQITTGQNYLNNVFVKDTLPDRIIYRPNSLKIDGVSVGGDIILGLNLGDLAPGQSKTITFDADISGSDKFNFGETQLVNSVTVTAAQTSINDTATVLVRKAAVAGAATGVSTGFKNNFFLSYLFLPLIISLLTLLFFKPYFLKLKESLIQRIDEYKNRNYNSEEALRTKIDQIRKKEYKEYNPI